MLTGAEKPDKGSIRLGDTVKIGYVDQSRAHLDDKKTVWEEISGGLDQMLLGGKKKSRAGRIAAGSTSRVPTSRRRSACCPAANATACISPNS